MAAPLRVAVVGSGPSGFYAAGSLLTQSDRPVEVDMLERLPTPWGLVRSGVAPDHPKIKSVTRVFEKTSEHPRFRWYGNVEVGHHISRAELLERYDAVIYAVGAEAERPLRIPGVSLPGVAPARHFVGWYNGHPEHRDHEFDLSVEHAIVIGNGNVAVDAARMLCLSRDELHATDVAQHALEALAASAVRDIALLGRRGAAQAAFTTPELRELGELELADVIVDRQDLELDGRSHHLLSSVASPTTKRNVELLRDFSTRERHRDKPRAITLRFLRSPIEIVGDGRVEGVVVSINRLVERADGVLEAEPTGLTETLPAGLVLSSIGYRGRRLAGVPFDDARGVIPNEDGRVVGGDREYVTGWIKRGPSGIIGTNKKCAQATVTRLLADLTEPAAAASSTPEIATWLAARQPRLVLGGHWAAINAHELHLGELAGRPRIKLTRVEELLVAGHGT